MNKKYSIGIDIGGTNTDAVIIDQSQNIISSCKITTTYPLTDGLRTALKTICDQTNARPEDIRQINIGTTHATNALLEGANLLRVGVLRLSSNVTQTIPPCFDWPEDLRKSTLAGFALVSGGYECDGQLIAPLNPAEIQNALKVLLQQGMQSLAIVGVFSPLHSSQEEQTYEIARSTLGADFPISLSHTIGNLHFIERENATIINSALKQCIQDGFSSLQQEVRRAGFACPIFITQNNGTIITLEHALKYPVLTISSGPTNSFVGATKLTGVQDAIVVDIGGTSTDIGIVLNGFARRCMTNSQIAGITLNFAMPDVISIPMGGGSYIKQQNNTITIGPRSCARNLQTESLIFGGNSMTLTDIFCALQYAALNNALNITIDESLAQQTYEIAQKIILQLCAQMAGKHKDLPIIFIGGGAQLFAQSPLSTKVIIPTQAGVANALGAACSQVSGTVDTITSLTNKADTLVQLIDQAKTEAIKQGADAVTLKLVEQQIIPYPYSSNNMARVKITVTGTLQI